MTAPHTRESDHRLILAEEFSRSGYTTGLDPERMEGFVNVALAAMRRISTPIPLADYSDEITPEAFDKLRRAVEKTNGAQRKIISSILTPIPLTPSDGTFREALECIANHSLLMSDFPHDVKGFQNFAKSALASPRTPITPSDGDTFTGRLYPLKPGETAAGYSCNGVNVEGDAKSIEAVRKAFWEAASQKQRADILMAKITTPITPSDEMVDLRKAWPIVRSFLTENGTMHGDDHHDDDCEICDIIQRTDAALNLMGGDK